MRAEGGPSLTELNVTADSSNLDWGICEVSIKRVCLDDRQTLMTLLQRCTEEAVN